MKLVPILAGFATTFWALVGSASAQGDTPPDCACSQDYNDFPKTATVGANTWSLTEALTCTISGAGLTSRCNSGGTVTWSPADACCGSSGLWHDSNNYAQWTGQLKKFWNSCTSGSIMPDGHTVNCRPATDYLGCNAVIFDCTGGDELVISGVTFCASKQYSCVLP